MEGAELRALILHGLLAGGLAEVEDARFSLTRDQVKATITWYEELLLELNDEHENSRD